jgi:hypothetical protein
VKQIGNLCHCVIIAARGGRVALETAAQVCRLATSVGGVLTGAAPSGSS